MKSSRKRILKNSIPKDLYLESLIIKRSTPSKSKPQSTNLLRDKSFEEQRLQSQNPLEKQILNDSSPKRPPSQSPSIRRSTSQKMMSSRYSNDNCLKFPKVHTSRERHLRSQLIKRPTIQKSISTKERSLTFGSTNTTVSGVYSSNILISQIKILKTSKYKDFDPPKINVSTSRDPDHQGVYHYVHYQ